MTEQPAKSRATAGELALDKLEASETLARFYAVVQRYDCDGTDYNALDGLIADEMVYLTPNLTDPAPVSRDQFLAHFKEIHDVHAYGRRGSFYALSGPVASIDGDRARVSAHIALCHWLSPANEHSTWFYGSIEADLVRASAGWQIAKLDASTVVRVDGHAPPVNAFHPPIEESHLAAT